MIKPVQTLNVKSRILDVSKPLVMGILNITENSFFDGGKYLQQEALTGRIKEMITEQVDIIDIGAMSSRPGAGVISKEIELDRICMGIEAVREISEEVIISVDTWRAEIADKAISLGAGLINDISAGSLDHQLLETIASHRVPFVLMHMQGNPQNMQLNPSYEHVVEEILDFFVHKIEILHQYGIYDIIIDPGFGFGKTIEHNYQILRDLQAFQFLEYPILVGISRKSMIYKPLGTIPSESLAGTSALHFVALQNGARILRVHDVKEVKQVIGVWNCYRRR